MKFETKFNIGDNVWFDYLGKCYEGRIYAISPVVYSSNMVHIIYNIMFKMCPIERDENHVFRTKQELLDSL